MMKFKVTTKLRESIKDIQGDVIEQKLNQDDWHVKDVKVGQVFYLEAPYEEINELCKQVLVNTLLYDYEIFSLSTGFKQVIEDEC
ncbi:phosphoribosylformylglycinamidine synthase subunit PurS [Marine Group I thaumarchaeote]|uniref:Phosphoribosylformylglycinamidine synthase subunit PurS n=1 Tax=Marine Group I thaumarchaeote TaxID=2511932 RepID=A0A7K4MQR9_9ARCH|nr:phosphoribosylformylglycinamidine synthase subunit PurS [Marine Group I thaumarchaeote]